MALTSSELAWLDKLIGPKKSICASGIAQLYLASLTCEEKEEMYMGYEEEVKGAGRGRGGSNDSLWRSASLASSASSQDYRKRSDTEGSICSAEDLVQQFPELERKNKNKGWVFTRVCGALLLVIDREHQTFMFMIIDLKDCVLRFQHELYEEMEYMEIGPHLHGFEIEHCVAGFKFSQEAIAAKFHAKALSLIPASGSSGMTKKGGAISKYKSEEKTNSSFYGLSSFFTRRAHASLTTNASELIVPKKNAQVRQHQQEVEQKEHERQQLLEIEQKHNSVKATAVNSLPAAATTVATQNVSFPRRRKRDYFYRKFKGKSTSPTVSPTVIGKVTGWTHNMHIGQNADGTFDVSNIPSDWKNIFKQAGIRKCDLRDPSMSVAIHEALVSSGVKTKEHTITRSYSKVINSFPTSKVSSVIKDESSTVKSPVVQLQEAPKRQSVKSVLAEQVMMEEEDTPSPAPPPLDINENIEDEEDAPSPAPPLLDNNENIEDEEDTPSPAPPPLDNNEYIEEEENTPSPAPLPLDNNEYVEEEIQVSAFKPTVKKNAQVGPRVMVSAQMFFDEINIHDGNMPQADAPNANTTAIKRITTKASRNKPSSLLGEVEKRIVDAEKPQVMPQVQPQLKPQAKPEASARPSEAPRLGPLGYLDDIKKMRTSSNGDEPKIKLQLCPTPTVASSSGPPSVLDEIKNGYESGIWPITKETSSAAVQPHIAPESEKRFTTAAARTTKTDAQEATPAAEKALPKALAQVPVASPDSPPSLSDEIKNGSLEGELKKNDAPRQPSNSRRGNANVLSVEKLSLADYITGIKNGTFKLRKVEHMEPLAPSLPAQPAFLEEIESGVVRLRSRSQVKALPKLETVEQSAQMGLLERLRLAVQKRREDIKEEEQDWDGSDFDWSDED